MQAPARHREAEQLRIFGARMRQARELCNLSQHAAALRLGYATQAPLSKIESAVDVRSIPLSLIQKAAQVYEVSVDFLFGASDDWECEARMTQEREVSAWLFAAWNEARLKDLAALGRLHARLSAMHESVDAMLWSSQDIAEALDRFSQLNPTFESHMRGGARLVAAVDRTLASTRQAKARLARFQQECKTAAAGPQLSLALDDNDGSKK